MPNGGLRQGQSQVTHSISHPVPVIGQRIERPPGRQPGSFWLCRHCQQALSPSRLVYSHLHEVHDRVVAVLQQVGLGVAGVRPRTLSPLPLRRNQQPGAPHVVPCYITYTEKAAPLLDPDVRLDVTLRNDSGCGLQSWENRRAASALPFDRTRLDAREPEDSCGRDDLLLWS